MKLLVFVVLGGLVVTSMVRPAAALPIFPGLDGWQAPDSEARRTAGAGLDQALPGSIRVPPPSQNLGPLTDMVPSTLFRHADSGLPAGTIASPGSGLLHPDFVGVTPIPEGAGGEDGNPSPPAPPRKPPPPGGGNVVPTPEPGTLILLGLGFAALASLGARRKKTH